MTRKGKKRPDGGGRRDSSTVDYVPHPRFGAGPRYTGLDPDPNADDVHFNYLTNFLTNVEKANMRRYCGSVPEPRPDVRHIPGTAIVADLGKQTPATIPATHYYDIEKRCRDCNRLFLFFAEEQKHWYEELGFSLDSDCVRCVPCRKKTQVLQSNLRRYEDLAARVTRSVDEDAEMAACRMDLVEDGIFHVRQLEQVRRFLNRHPDHPSAGALRERIGLIEQPD